MTTATEQDDKRHFGGLTDRQIRAALEILESPSLSEAARRCGVPRQKLSNWFNHEPEFQAFLNELRLELIGSRLDAIRRADLLAIELIVEALVEGDLEVAMFWVRLRRLSEADVASIGPTRPDAILDERSKEIQMRPENSGLLYDLPGIDGGMSRRAAREAAEAEVEERLNGDAPIGSAE